MTSGGDDDDDDVDSTSLSKSGGGGDAKTAKAGGIKRDKTKSVTKETKAEKVEAPWPSIPSGGDVPTSNINRQTNKTSHNDSASKSEPSGSAKNKKTAKNKFSLTNVTRLSENSSSGGGDGFAAQTNLAAAPAGSNTPSFLAATSCLKRRAILAPLPNGMVSLIGSIDPGGQRKRVRFNAEPESFSMDLGSCGNSQFRKLS